MSGRVGCFFCTHPKCSYTSSKRVHVAKHAESCHIQGYSVSCLACSEVFPTLASYGRHSCHVERSLRQYQVTLLACFSDLYNSVLKVHRNEASSESQDRAASRQEESVKAAMNKLKENHRLRELVVRANAKYVCRIKDQLAIAIASFEKLTIIKKRFGEVDYRDSDMLREVENRLKEEKVKRLPDQLYKDLQYLVQAAVADNSVKFMSFVSKSEFQRSYIELQAMVLFGCEAIISCA